MLNRAKTMRRRCICTPSRYFGCNEPGWRVAEPPPAHGVHPGSAVGYAALPSFNGDNDHPINYRHYESVNGGVWSLVCGHYYFPLFPILSSNIKSH